MILASIMQLLIFTTAIFARKSYQLASCPLFLIGTELIVVEAPVYVSIQTYNFCNLAGCIIIINLLRWFSDSLQEPVLQFSVN